MIARAQPRTSLMRQLAIQSLTLGVVLSPSVTSSLDVEPLWDLGSLGTGSSAPRWLPATIQPAEAPPTVDSQDLKTRIEALKQVSGLTWGQLAGALGVDPRTLHFWRTGGGVREEHEARLRALIRLAGAIADRAGAGVREELLSEQLGPSLLSRLEVGQPPGELHLAAPWRATAGEDLDANIARLESEDPLAEDFAFLFSLTDEAIEHLQTDARARLADPGNSRSDWEQFIEDAAREATAPHVPLESDLDASAYEEQELPAFLTLDDLNLSMRPGAIAARGDRS